MVFLFSLLQLGPESVDLFLISSQEPRCGHMIPVSNFHLRLLDVENEDELSALLPD